jgi:hypothetical protein
MGHLHRGERIPERAGMEIEVLQSPVPKDSFASSAGYRGGRSMQAITFDAERGEVSRVRVNL